MNWFYTELLSLQDLNQVNDILNILKEHAIKFKTTVESTQRGLPNSYSVYNTPSFMDVDNSEYSKIYIICVERKDVKKAKELLRLK